MTAEITVASDWSSLLCQTGASAEPAASTPIEGKEITLVRNLFSREEAEALIAAAEAPGFGFGMTNYPKEYRGNLRLTAMDRGLADAVWGRIKLHVPAIVEECGQRFEAVGLNECWRLSKYHPGDRFQAHVDSCYNDERNSRKSMFTVNIYMNDAFSGGATTFFFDVGASSRSALPVTKAVDIIPETGLCLLFRQPPSKHYMHEGKAVLTGTKYLFRSDVMYRPV